MAPIGKVAVYTMPGFDSAYDGTYPKRAAWARFLFSMPPTNP
jgi:hypothetical protein